MTESIMLLPQQVSRLLPLLSQLAANIRDFGAPEPRDLEMLLQALDLTDEELQRELGRWARILTQVRGETDTHMLAYARSGLQLRGVPEANAILAVNYASGIAVQSQPMPPPQTEVPPIPKTVQPLRVSEEIVGFGLLPPGESAQRTVYIEGGPGIVHVTNSRVEVVPKQFGSERTPLVVTVYASGDSNLLLAPCSLESKTERVEMEILAEWGSLPAKNENFPLPVPLPPFPPSRQQAPPPPVIVPEPRKPVAKPEEPGSPKTPRATWPSGRWKT